MADRKRCCCNCGNCKRVPKETYIENYCAIDGHRIGYIETFEGWCRRWKKSHTFCNKRGELTMPNTREKLIELLEQSLNNDGTGREMRFTGGDVTPCLIANGVTVQGDKDINVPTKWISVKDRLPEEHRLVLCRWTRGIGASYGFARYQHENDVWYVSNEGMPEVTHWMPLPPAPEDAK